MRALIVRTSSLGDVLLTLPAVSDACARIPGLRCDWVVEESFSSVPAWHPCVSEVITVATRRWRRQPGAIVRGEWLDFLRRLRQHRYDLVIDAQGLMKSALITRLARGRRIGPDRSSARERPASLAYDHRVTVDPNTHAVARNRALFASAFGYTLPDTTPDYGLTTSPPTPPSSNGPPTVLFLTGTTWATKLWPESYWRALLQRAASHGLKVRFPWGTDAEHDRVRRIADGCPSATVLPRLSLDELAMELRQARSAVAVDSGLAHLAAALGRPCLTLYGPTDPDRIGTCGADQYHLRSDFDCGPCARQRCSRAGADDIQPACFAAVTPDTVWDRFTALFDASAHTRPC